MKLTRRSLLLSAAAPLAKALDAAPSNCSVCRPCDDTIDCFELRHFPTEEHPEHMYYVGGSGPPVLVLHELPGLTRQDIRFANKVICQGYTVILPLLFGIPGQDRFWHSLFTECGAEKFDCGGHTQTAPALTWVRNLCATIREKWPEGEGIGVVGMCLTGEFPISLLQLSEVKGVVLCQPTDPFNALTLVHLGPGSKLSLSPEDIRSAKMSKIPVLGIKYSGDRFCPDSRFRTLAGLFPSHFYWLELSGMHHSSLGGDFCEIAFEEVCIYLSQQLKGKPLSPDRKFPHHSRCTSTAPEKKECHSHAGSCPS